MKNINEAANWLEVIQFQNENRVPVSASPLQQGLKQKSAAKAETTNAGGAGETVPALSKETAAAIEPESVIAPGAGAADVVPATAVEVKKPGRGRPKNRHNGSY